MLLMVSWSSYSIITYFDGLMIMITYIFNALVMVSLSSYDIVYHIISWWFYLYHYLVSPKLREEWHCEYGNKCSWLSHLDNHPCLIFFWHKIHSWNWLCRCYGDGHQQCLKRNCKDWWGSGEFEVLSKNKNNTDQVPILVWFGAITSKTSKKMDHLRPKLIDRSCFLHSITGNVGLV